MIWWRAGELNHPPSWDGSEACLPASAEGASPLAHSPRRGRPPFESSGRGFNNGKTAKGVYPAASIEERLRLKSRRHEQAWFGGGQVTQPSLVPLLRFDIQGVALVAEKLTRGLRISDKPTSDTLTPQETMTQPAPHMGLMGLVCPVLVAAW